MSILQAIIYGVAQGAGEFLPISSTAHLILIPYFFHWSDPGLAFDVALHFGTLIAVVAFFWKDWIKIISSFFYRSQANEWMEESGEGKFYNPKFIWFLIVATIPGAIFGYFLDDWAESVFRNPLIIAFTLAVMGLILFIADKTLKARKDLNSITWKDSLLIGISQAVAIIPGVSRSGATITSGLFLGLDKSSAARFSFLLSTPIILGAVIFKFPELIESGLNLEILLGVLFSALSGYLAIKYLLKFVEKVGYKVFFWYRLALAILVLTFYFLL